MAMTGVLLAVNVYTALALDPVAAYMWTLAVGIGVSVSSSSIAAYLLHRMRKDWRQDYLYKPSGPFFIYCALACSRLAYLLGIDVIIDKLFVSSRCTSQAALVHFFDLYALFALISVLWSTTSDAVTVMVEYPSVDVKSAHLEQLMRLATGGALGIDVDPVALGELKQIVPKMADRTDQADAEDALKLAKLEERDQKQKEKYFKENEKFFKSAEKRRKKMRQKELAERRKRGENVPDEPSTASEEEDEAKPPGRFKKLFGAVAEKLKRKKSEANTEADAQSTRESRAASEAQSNAGDADATDVDNAESQAGDRDRAESQAGDNTSQAGESQAADGVSQAGDNPSQNEYQVDGKANGGGLKGGRKGRGADDESAAGDSAAGDSAAGESATGNDEVDATDNDAGDATDNDAGDAPLEEDYQGDEVEDESEFDPDEARKREEEELLEQQEREEKEDEEDEMNLFEEDEESEDEDDDSDEEDDEAKAEQDKINSLKQIPATLAKGFLGFLCGGSEQPAAQEGENERFLRKAKNKARTKGLDQKQFEQKLKEYANKTGAAMQGTVAARKQNEADLAEAIRRAQKTEKIRKRRERRKREKQRQANMLNEMTRREAGPGTEGGATAPGFPSQGSGTGSFNTPRSRGASVGRSGSFGRGMSRMSLGLGSTAANLMRQGSRMSVGGYSQGGGFAPGPEAAGPAPGGGHMMPVKGYEPATGPSGGDSKGTLVTLSYPARIAEMVRQVITRPLIVVTEEQLKQGYVRAQSAHEFTRIRNFIGNNLRKTGRVLPARELQIPLTTHIICVFGAFILTIIPLAGNIFGFVGYICAIQEGGVGFTFAKVYILMGYYMPHWIVFAVSLLLTFSLWVVKGYCYPATPNGPHQVEVCFRRLVWYPACLAGSYILPSMHAWFLHQHTTLYEDSEVMYAATFNMISFCAMAFLFAMGLLVVETYVGKRDRNIVKGDPLVAKPVPKEETNLEEMPINLRRLLARDRFWLLMNSIEERKDTVLGEFCPRCQAHSHRLVLHRKAEAFLAMQQLEWEQQEKERLEALEREENGDDNENDINDYMGGPQQMELPPLNFDNMGSSQLSMGQQSNQSNGSQA